ncbi:hypothetical protein PG993_005474 [Apiospora rasikravindrae]|uniref:Rhodopsin domain-containing protein n=1 Tax=Apiospora rasikravindrae TaxID=990691 RepID=A0ABR1TFN6_9PEZI
MASRQPEIYGAVTITLIASTSALILRLIARRMKRLTLWFDDYLAIVAWAAALAYDIGTYIWLEIGLGLHLDDLHISFEPADHYRELFQFILEQAYTISIAGSQLSLLALYWRAFGPALESRMCIVMIAACSVMWFLCRVGVTITLLSAPGSREFWCIWPLTLWRGQLFIVTFQCNPPEAKWSYSVKGDNCPVDTGKFFLATVTAHLILDVLLMILPACEYMSITDDPVAWFQLTADVLRANTKTPSSFVGENQHNSSFPIWMRMMSVGITYDPQSRDVFWVETDPALWSAVEINLSVITACLPLMRPLFQRMGCCVDRKAERASQRQDSYEMTKLPSGSRATVQNLEDAAMGYPTSPGPRSMPYQKGFTGTYAPSHFRALWALGSSRVNSQLV